MLQEIPTHNSEHIEMDVFREENEEILLHDELVDIDLYNPEIRDLTPQEISLLNRIVSIIKLGLPMAFADTFALKQMILPILLSHLDNDTEHTAANGLICTVIGMLMVTSLAPLFGISIIGVGLVKEYKATEEGSEERAKKTKELVDLYRNGLFYSALIAPVVITPLYFSEPLLNLFNQDPKVTVITQNFLRPFSLSVLPTFFYINALQLLQSFHFTPVMKATSASFIITLMTSIGLGYGIVFPELGEKGIQTGYIAEPFITSLVMLAFLVGHKQFKNIPFFSNLFTSLNGNSHQFLALMKTGGWITLCVLVDLVMGFSTSAIAGNIGLKEQAALALTMLYLLANSVFAVHLPLATMLHSGEIDKSNKQSLKTIIKAGLISSMAVGAIIPVFFAISPSLLTKMMGVDDPEIDNILNYLAPLMSLGSIFEVLRFVLLFQLRIMNEMKSSAMVFINCQIAGLILSASLAFGTDAGIYGTAAGYVFAVLSSSAVLSIQLYQKMNAPSQENLTKTTRVQSQQPSRAKSLGFLGIFSKAEKIYGVDEEELEELRI